MSERANERINDVMASVFILTIRDIIIIVINYPKHELFSAGVGRDLEADGLDTGRRCELVQDCCVTRPSRRRCWDIAVGHPGQHLPRRAVDVVLAQVTVFQVHVEHAT